MRSPDGKSQRGDDGGKGVGSDGNDEETEDGSIVCTGDEVERRQARNMAEGYKKLHAGGDGRSNGVGIIVNEEISKEVVRVERWQGRIIVVCVCGPQTGRTEAGKEAFREEVERLAGLSDGRDVEKELVGGRGHVLPEEGEP